MKTKFIFILIILLYTAQVFSNLYEAICECNLQKIEEILKKRLNVIDNIFWHIRRAIEEEKINIDQAKSICMLLMQYGINMKKSLSNDLSINAISAENTELVKLFIDCGLDVNVKSKFKYLITTPLIIAASYDCPQIVQYLINHGATIDTKDNFGDTALIQATYLNRSLIVYLLLINGADTTIIDKYGKTFFDHIKDKPIIIKLYKEIKEVKRKKIYDIISKANGFNQDMPADLVNMISDYDY